MRQRLRDCDILLVQEHWYSNTQLSDNVFEKYFPEYSCHGVSGMNDKKILVGRPYGGCAILLSNSLLYKIYPVNIDGYRVCGIRFDANGISYLLCHATCHVILSLTCQT